MKPSISTVINTYKIPSHPRTFLCQAKCCMHMGIHFFVKGKNSKLLSFTNGNIMEDTNGWQSKETTYPYVNNGCWSVHSATQSHLQHPSGYIVIIIKSNLWRQEKSQPIQACHNVRIYECLQNGCGREGRQGVGVWLLLGFVCKVTRGYRNCTLSIIYSHDETFGYDGSMQGML